MLAHEARTGRRSLPRRRAYNRSVRRARRRRNTTPLCHRVPAHHSKRHPVRGGSFVHLAPGESRVVSMPVRIADLARFDPYHATPPPPRDGMHDGDGLDAPASSRADGVSAYRGSWVVDGGTYVGMARLDDISELNRDEWENLTIADVMATELPTARPSWSATRPP